MPDKLRIAMLISGGGTTMQSIIQACKSGVLRDKVEPGLVIASRPEAGGIQKAMAEGIPEKDVLVISKKDYPDELAFGKAILKACQDRSIDFIGQYGWMVLTPPNVIEEYKNMMVNQHPGPLDPGRSDFGGQGMYGMRVHCAVLYFARSIDRPFSTEATAQRVAVEYDQGLVLKTQAVPIKKSDDPSSLQQSVLPVEHQVQIATLADFANGTVKERQLQKPLILPEEKPILEEAKKISIKLFPKG